MLPGSVALVAPKTITRPFFVQGGHKFVAEGLGKDGGRGNLRHKAVSRNNGNLIWDG